MVKKVRTEYLEKLPQWYKNKNAKYQTVLSDDIDGIVSTNILKQECGWTTEYFYDFKSLYVSDDFLYAEDKHATRVWADVAFCLRDRDEMGFDNHVSRVNNDDHMNKLMINPNLLKEYSVRNKRKDNWFRKGRESRYSIWDYENDRHKLLSFNYSDPTSEPEYYYYKGVSNQNYYSKYSGSTALLIWSIYKAHQLPSTPLGKSVLLTIDAAFKGFYSDNESIRATNEDYMTNILGFPELSRMCDTRYPKQNYYNLIDAHHLTYKISIGEDGYLRTGLDLEWLSNVLEMDITLPKKHFNKLVDFNPHGREQFDSISSIMDVGDPVTFAFVGKGVAKYSTLI